MARPAPLPAALARGPAAFTLTHPVAQIIALQATLGNRWAAISRKCALPPDPPSPPPRNAGPSRDSTSRV